MAKAPTVKAAAEPKVKKPRPTWAPQDGLAQIKLNADGEMSRPDLEGLALLLADDVPGPTAWVDGLGKHNSGPPGRLRRHAEKHPVFLERLGRLQQEKAALETDPTWGHVEWMAKQLWREARLKNDTKAMIEAANLAFKVAKEKTGSDQQSAAPTPAGDDDVLTGPGRPAARNPQNNRDPTVLRGLLATRGLKVEQPAKKAEESDENDD